MGAATGIQGVHYRFEGLSEGRSVKSHHAWKLIILFRLEPAREGRSAGPAGGRIAPANLGRGKFQDDQRHRHPGDDSCPTRAVIDLDEAVGQTLGRYKLLERGGEGGLAVPS